MVPKIVNRPMLFKAFTGYPFKFNHELWPSYKGSFAHALNSTAPFTHINTPKALMSGLIMLHLFMSHQATHLKNPVRHVFLV